jgi:hypothetical protein
MVAGSRSQLPNELAAFLAAASNFVVDLYQPAWIKGSLEAPDLQIDFIGTPATEDSRSSAFGLNTNFYAPPGRLSDADRQVFRRQMIMLLISFIDGSIAPSRNETNVRVFWAALMRLAEYWATAASKRQLAKGLVGISLDAVSEVLVAFKDSGSEGITDMRGAWEDDIWRRVAALSRFDFDAIEAALDVETRDAIKRRCEEQRRKGELPQGDLRAALLLLASEQAYDALGFVSSSYVVKVIGGDVFRVGNNGSLQVHLRRYALSENFERQSYRKYGIRSQLDSNRPQLLERAAKPKSIDVLAAGLRYVSAAACNVAEFAESELALPEEIKKRIAAEDRTETGRTASMPAVVALKVVRGCVDWILNIAPQLEQLCLLLSEIPFRKSGANPRNFAPSMGDALASINHPLLKRFGVRGFDGCLRRCDPDWSRPRPFSEQTLGFVDLLDLHFAFCFSIVALMGCMRRGEVMDLMDGDLVRGRHDSLVANLRKRQIDSVRRRVTKPVPRIVGLAIESMIRIRNIWRGCLPSKHGGAAHVFSRLTRSGLSGAEDAGHLYKTLDFLSEFLELKQVDGSCWYVRPHQLRKSFAMSFFHHGGKEKSLPALSWFMGHRSVADTWRYVRSQLTGSEISASEAQMATMAVLSQDKSKAVEKLRNLLRLHFNCETLSVMSEVDLQGYLEHLHRKGKYKASPVEIRTSKGSRVAVLVSIREEI